MSKLSLFSRIYLSMVLAVFVSMVLTEFIVDAQSEIFDFKVFARDANNAAKIIINCNDLSQVGQPKKLVIPYPINMYSMAHIVPNGAALDICESCAIFKSTPTVTYYELENGVHVAAFKVADSPNTLIISERAFEQLDDSSLEAQMDQADEMIFFVLVIITSLVLAFALYWPLKSLHQQINQLIKTNEKFGQGNLQVNACEDIQKPLNQLAASFNVMVRSIAENVKERDIFSQAIPHEIRTPLSRIQLAAGLIRKKTNDQDIVALVDDVDNYVVDINELIREIVEYSKISTDKEQATQLFQTIELKPFVESRLKVLAHAQNKKISIDIASSLELTTSPIYLRLMIDNFVKNALNHAQQAVTISAKIIDAQLLIAVEDDGHGVAWPDRATIFIPFARLDKSRSRKTGGLGLGLPIAKAAAQKMQGEISVSDSSLGGAKFLFTRQLT